MNDERTVCETWLEPISLLAAGSLSAEEERDLRRHLAGCPACRTRFEQMAGLVGRLRTVRATPAEFDLASLVTRTMSQVADARTGSREPLATPVPAMSSRPRATGRQAVAERRLSSWAVVILTLATCVTAVAILGRWSRHVVPRKLDIVQDVSPGPAVATNQATQDDVASLGPTLAELRQAAAESDEALDQMLSRRSISLSAESFSSRSLWQESL